MTELLPCPFCGGPAKIERTMDRQQDWWGVACRNTLNRGGTCAIEQRPSASIEAATERWNTRAVPDLSAEVERLREAMKPFALIADNYSEAEDDTFEPWIDGNAGGVTKLAIADFRKARAALNPDTKDG